MVFVFLFFFLMQRRPPRSTLTDTLFPYTTLVRSRNGIDLAFRVFGRTQRRAGVEVGTPVPLPVPAVLVDIDAQPFRLFAAFRRKGAIIAGIGQIGEPPQYLVKEKSQPYAFARALVADLVPAVVPVARTPPPQAVRSQ